MCSDAHADRDRTDRTESNDDDLGTDGAPANGVQRQRAHATGDGGGGPGDRGKFERVVTGHGSNR